MHVELGVNASVVEPVRELRFCLTCDAQGLAAHGERWWRRSHQLPGVLVCHEHAEPLRRSRATFWTGGQHGFSPASRVTCPDDAEPMIRDVSPRVMEDLFEIARRSARLLTGRSSVASYEDLSNGYRARLFGAGLMRTERQISIKRLLDGFRARLGGTLELMPRLLSEEGRFDRWLLEMVRTNRKFTHPLQHVLLRMFLDGLPVVNDPIGRGPWLCRNPVGGHDGEPTVLTASRLRQGDWVCCTFECPCGYAYTMSYDAAGNVRGPRFKRFGPTLDPALRSLVAGSATLRGAAKGLGVHPRFVAAAAKRLELGKAWKASETAGPRLGSSGPAVRRRVTPSRPPVPRAPPGPRLDWARLDDELVTKVDEAVVQILAAMPPERVCMRAIEMRLARPAYIFLRAAKLPRTTASVTAATEELDAFQRRRVDWAIGALSGVRELTVSAVMRKAGLRSDWKAYVASKLA